MMKLRETGSVVQNHMVCKWQSWDYNQQMYATKGPLYPSLSHVDGVCMHSKIGSRIS